MTKLNLSESYQSYNGEIEITIFDKHKNVLHTIRENNLIKIFAKEILPYRVVSDKVWDPDGSGGGAWVEHSIRSNEFSLKYILIGASFDSNGSPLGTNDSRYYIIDPNTNTPVPVRPNVGADNNGDLINPVPISEPTRPLKRIENIEFNPTYQPSANPIIQDNVRAISNILVLETTLRLDEYNGFGNSGSDTFTITEIGLAAGPEIDSVGACECTPHILFLNGLDGLRTTQLPGTVNGNIVTLDASLSTENIDVIKEGDQLYLVGEANTSTDSYNELNQTSPYYLVINKPLGSRTIVLDRNVEESDSTPITGDIGVYKSSLRLFSQRILSSPITKSSAVEVLIRWRLLFN